MLTIPSGRYPVRPSLTVHLDGSLDLPPGRFWLLTGDNGAGKTSFVKAVVLPRIMDHLKEDHGLLLYVDQEFGIQYYTVKAHAATAGRDTGAGFGFSESLDYLTELYATAPDRQPLPDLYVVCDETEVFGSLERLLARLASSRPAVVAVTHAPEHLPAGPDRWRLTFTRTAAAMSCAVPTRDPVS